MPSAMRDFTNTTIFPTFLTIPEKDQDAVAPPSSSAPAERWYLLAQIKDNMTINKPTLVLTDRDANPFALVFEGLGRDDLDLKGLGFKKGSTAVIPNAMRTKPADESKRGFVRVEKGDAGSVRAVPCSLARVLELGGKVKGSKCETCGVDDGKDLKGCTGCGRAGYCSKVSAHLCLCDPTWYQSQSTRLSLTSILSQECQVKGWNEGGHKTDCKALKTLNDIFT